MPEQSSRTRKPAVAGRFYPSDRAELEAMVDRFISSGEPAGNEPVFGIVVPHAGYVFSGATAGKAFARIKNTDFVTAVVIGSGHRDAAAGAGMYAKGAFETPLGVTPVDEELAEALKNTSPLFKDVPHIHDGEHSIEVQLPFLQRLGRPGLKILPVLVNTSDLDELENIGKALAANIKDRKALLVISTDLAHYPPAETAARADMAVLLSISVAVSWGDVNYFALADKLLMEKGLQNLDTVCCASPAVAAGIFCALAMGADNFDIIDHSLSSDSGLSDKNQVVGYGSGAFVKNGKENSSFLLSDKNKRGLLALARKSIESCLSSGKPFNPPLSDVAVYNIPAAAFVTLQKKGQLRGCIGSLEPRDTLQDAVARLAVSSAFDDPRFPPLRKEELNDISVEISILSPMKRSSPDDIIPGRHGVVVRRGYKGGTYLPQVWEHFHSKEDFMTSLCLEKAGLSADSWKDPKTEIYIYTADIITE